MFSALCSTMTPQDKNHLLNILQEVVNNEVNQNIIEADSNTHFYDEVLRPISIKELDSLIFNIPPYQRGYRWTEQEVQDLLDDLFEFQEKSNSSDCYYIQPLVVKKNEHLSSSNRQVFDVIDGQQRLTTIFMIYKCLTGKTLYEMKYETGDDGDTGNANYLRSICTDDDKAIDALKDINRYHIYQAYRTIVAWKLGISQDYLSSLEKVFLNQVKFIWYQVNTDHPEDVFTRLNIGKISLNNAEIIKALLLNSANFSIDNKLSKPKELGDEWDRIERMLQRDDFWFFLRPKNDQRDSRIELFFDTIYEQNKLAHKELFPNISVDPLDEGDIKKAGNDKWKTFRYFYLFFKKNRDNYEQCVEVAWGLVRSMFYTFNEWYNDTIMYHYVGYLIAIGRYSAIDLLDEYDKSENSSKETFHSFVRQEIRNTLAACIANYDVKDIMSSEQKRTEFLNNLMDKQYEKKDKSWEVVSESKTQTRPLLLLHNIMTIIDQAERMNRQDEVSYRFPFHLYKNEDWDIEHIESNTPNNLNDSASAEEWLLNIYFLLPDQKNFSDLKSEIENILIKNKANDNEENNNKTRSLITRIRDEFFHFSEEDALNDMQKNRIWNFALLDSNTNRSYHNAIFPAKRRIIMSKDQGRLTSLPLLSNDGKIIPQETNRSCNNFFPVCTKQAFMKYYSSAMGNVMQWTRNDAEAYRNDIIAKFEKLFPINNDNLDSK